MFLQDTMEWHEIQKQMKTCGDDLLHHSMELEKDEDVNLKTLQFIVTYFAPRRQHTVEVLTQNGLYCTFQHSPQFLFAYLQKKIFIVKISSGFLFVTSEEQ